jgi:hypothetical protein
MLDVYKFLEEKKKPTLPPGIVDLSSAPRVSMPAPPAGILPLFYCAYALYPCAGQGEATGSCASCA